MSSPNPAQVALEGVERSTSSALALNAEAGAPEWVMLWPNGDLVVGRDRREFVIRDPAAIIAATRGRLPLLVDYEHDSVTRQPGVETPAAGWIVDLAVREGAIWGRVEWTGKAAHAIADKQYRYHSPVYLYRRGTSPMEVVAIDGAGLTHRPNLDLPALNNQQDNSMDKAILEALGLTGTPTTDDVVAAINALQTPAPGRFVPRADYDLALNRAEAAERELVGIRQAQNAARAEALIDGAIAAGKIAPASREHYLRLAVNSFGEVRALVEASPVLVQPGVDSDLANGDPAQGGGALSESQRALCSALNLKEEEFIAAQA
jgi:phage I-like protein